MIEWIKHNPKCALWAEPGLGKTVATLTALKELRAEGKVNRVLVVAPLRVSHSVWPREPDEWEHLEGMTAERLYWPESAENKLYLSTKAISHPKYETKIFVEHYTKWLKDKLSLSDAVIEKASYIYRKALEKGLVKGRSISALIAASLYAACRDTETPRTLKDVSDAGNIKKKDISRCYRILHQELELKMPVVDPVQCVARIASSIGITEKTKRYAVKVLKDAQAHEESAGKDPMGLAAAALYLSCVKNGEDKTQRDIAEAANVTEVTIRNRYKGLKESLDL